MLNLSIAITGVAGLTEVLGAFAPQVVVIAGAHASDDDVARWAYRVRSASGEYRWFLARARPLLDEAGQVVLMYGAATDIHDIHEKKC